MRLSTVRAPGTLVLTLLAVVGVAVVVAGPVEWVPVRVSALVCAGAPILRVPHPALLASAFATCWVRFVHPANLDGPAMSDAHVLLWTLVETTGLLVLITLLVRAAPVRTAVTLGLACGAAEATVALRLVVGWGAWVQIFWVVVWALGAVGAACLGAYLRSLDTVRTRAVAGARQAQRLELARDLHDFVAHDLSGIVVQAQAGQLVADRDPRQAVAALRLIEQAGLQALAATDRAVHMLHDSPAARDVAPSLADLDDLIARFVSAAPSTQVIVNTTTDPVPREIDSTAYRIIVEALTNIRRHAPAAPMVGITISRTGQTLQVRVSNTGPGTVPSASRSRPQRRDASEAAGADRGWEPVGEVGRCGGLGLVGLRERVEVLGGTLRAGPVEAAGWVLEARFPVAAT